MSERYSVFAESQAALPLPFQTGDIILVVRAGVPYQIPPSAIRSLGPVVYVTPLTGATLTAVAGQGAFVVNPAGELANLTVILPPLPNDEQVFRLSTTQTLDALVVQPAAGDSVIGTAGGPFVLGANGALSFIFNVGDTSWYPF